MLSDRWCVMPVYPTRRLTPFTNRRSRTWFEYPLLKNRLQVHEIRRIVAFARLVWKTAPPFQTSAILYCKHYWRIRGKTESSARVTHLVLVITYIPNRSFSEKIWCNCGNCEDEYKDPSFLSAKTHPRKWNELQVETSEPENFRTFELNSKCSLFFISTLRIRIWPNFEVFFSTSKLPKNL